MELLEIRLVASEILLIRCASFLLPAMDLQAPSVLAQLPRPLHASTGKTHIGEVSSLVDSKKRKRYEVVVAVDGEAVNIYNVQKLSC